MKCPNCGFEIGEKDTICRGCGESVFNIKMRVKDNNITPKVEVKEKVETNLITPSSSEKEIDEKLFNNMISPSSTEVISSQDNNEIQQNNSEIDMMTTLKCPKCGATIEQNWNFCPSCHNKLNENALEFKEKYIPSNDEKIFSWICSFFLFAIAIIYLFLFINFNFNFHGITEIVLNNFLFQYIVDSTPLLYVIGIVLSIYGKVKYPKNNRFKILFWLYIILFILLVIFVFYLMESLVKACTSVG